jgi:hypothetical protein
LFACSQVPKALCQLGLIGRGGDGFADGIVGALGAGCVCAGAGTRDGALLGRGRGAGLGSGACGAGFGGVTGGVGIDGGGGGSISAGAGGSGSGTVVSGEGCGTVGGVSGFGGGWAFGGAAAKSGTDGSFGSSAAGASPGAVTSVEDCGTAAGASGSGGVGVNTRLIISVVGSAGGGKWRAVRASTTATHAWTANEPTNDQPSLALCFSLREAVTRAPAGPTGRQSDNAVVLPLDRESVTLYRTIL